MADKAVGLSQKERDIIDSLATEVVERRNSFPFRQLVESLKPVAAKAALHVFRSYLSQATKRGDQSSVAWSFLGVAMVLSGQRQYESALRELERANSIFSLTEEGLGMACVFREISYAHRELDRNALSLEYAHKAVVILESLKRTLEVGWLYDNMAVIFSNMGRRHESLSYARKARMIFAEHNDRSSLAWNACQLGNLNFDMGFFKEAETYYEEALQNFHLYGNSQGTAWAYLCMGVLRREESRYDDAEKQLEKARNEYQQLGLEDRVAWCLLNIAGIKYSKGELAAAEQLNKQAIQLFSPINNRDGVAWSLFQLARVECSRGQLMKAWKSAKGALERFEHIANQKGMGWADLELANIYLRLGDLMRAQESLIRAKVKAEQLDLLPLKAMVEKSLSGFYLNQGMLQKAADSLNEAEGICAKIGNKEIAADIWGERARYGLVVHNPALTRLAIQRAGQLIKRHGLKLIESFVDLCRVELESIEGKRPAVIKGFEAIAKAAEERHDTSSRLSALLALYQLTAKSSPARSAKYARTMENELRTFGSRAHKAKFLLAKFLFSRPGIGGKAPFTLANQALDILVTASLTLLRLQFLNLLQGFCEKNGAKAEGEKYRQEAEAIISNSNFDLRMAHPRATPAPLLPVSVVS